MVGSAPRPRAETKNDVLTEIFRSDISEELWHDDGTPSLTHEEVLANDLAFAKDPPQVQDAHATSNMASGHAPHRQSDEIGASTYEYVHTDKVADECKHLSEEQRQQLRQLLRKFPRLFSGKLGKYNGEKVHLDIDPNAEPHAARAYSVPRKHEARFKEELERLVEIGVLERCGRSRWMMPTFIVPKKDGKVRWVSDFRALNKVLKRRVYPIPRIQDILSRRSGYSWLTKLDISMQYYTMELDEASSEACTIVTPFGLYRYKRLPMGVSQSPDVAQEVMERVLEAIEDIEIYIDDIAAFSDTWDEHLELLDKVLSTLQEAGFTINLLKCEWGIQETDFLGHWLTPKGIKPWRKKVQGILDMRSPTNVSELRSFLGLMNYYRDMWPRRLHVLAPLTKEWTDRQEKAFKEMKALAAANVLLHYLDHNKQFDIETDASDYQLGWVIKQDGKPVAYLRRNSSVASRPSRFFVRCCWARTFASTPIIRISPIR